MLELVNQWIGAPGQVFVACLVVFEVLRIRGEQRRASRVLAVLCEGVIHDRPNYEVKANLVELVTSPSGVRNGH